MPPLQEHNEVVPQSNNNFSQTIPTRTLDNMSRSTGVPPRLRNDESWVDISSQPSSSSLSSVGDEIVTTGLRVRHDPNSRRRRRAPGPSPMTVQARQTSTSSQEEYEESESESEEDQVMTSSNEHIIPVPSRPEYDAGSDSDSEDENATALGRRTDAKPVFTPQPNAFSHPPSSRGVPNSYFPPSNIRPSYPPSRNSRQNSSFNHAADHDAALRASLTTLLSIGAAAARGLPKRENAPIMPSTEQMGLRFVSEAELLGPAPRPNSSRPLSPSTRARSSPSISSAEAVERGKRKASTTKPAGEKIRALKKKRTQVETEETIISPTLLTWVMSAGVVVLFSVVGFGAGYVIGREVGRGEAMTGLNASSLGGAGCAKEAVRGTGSLRRLKWGIGGGGRAVVA